MHHRDTTAKKACLPPSSLGWFLRHGAIIHRTRGRVCGGTLCPVSKLVDLFNAQDFAHPVGMSALDAGYCIRNTQRHKSIYRQQIILPVHHSRSGMFVAHRAALFTRTEKKQHAANAGCIVGSRVCQLYLLITRDTLYTHGNVLHIT